MSGKSDAEDRFDAAWVARGLRGSDLVREYRFHPERRWRFDFAWPSHKLAVEIDGRGRHQTVPGVRKDCEKHNAAVRMGWRVLRWPATDAKKDAGLWVDLVTEMLCGMDGQEQ